MVWYSSVATQVTQASHQAQKQARLHLVRVHKRITNRRQAFHWHLAHALCARYDTIYLEHLNLRGMQSLWGQKVNDLGFGNFLSILYCVAQKTGTMVYQIDRWFPSSKCCHVCQQIFLWLDLKQTQWRCDSCGTLHERDRNAARNVYQVGASTCGGSGVRPTWSAAD
jgi:putative transposase